MDVVEEIEADWLGGLVLKRGRKGGRGTFHAVLGCAGDFAADDFAAEGAEDEEAEVDCSN